MKMNKIVSCAAIFLAASTAAFAQAGAPERLVTRPGERIENVIETADGTLYMTGVFKGEVLRRAPDGKLDTLLTLHSPQGILAYKNGFVVDWQLRDPNFTDPKGPSFANLGAQLSILDGKGKVLKTLSGPDDAAFFNGMAFSAPDTLMIADPGGGRLLKADLKKGAVTVWLDKPALVSALGENGRPNGLKVHDGWVYFARGDVYKVLIGKDGGPSGAPVLAGKTGGTDDFDVAADGTIYTTSQKGILKITKDGAVSVFVAEAPSATAVRVSRDGKSIFVVGGGVPVRPNPVDGYLIKVAIN